MDIEQAFASGEGLQFILKLFGGVAVIAEKGHSNRPVDVHLEIVGTVRDVAHRQPGVAQQAIEHCRRGLAVKGDAERAEGVDDLLSIHALAGSSVLSAFALAASAVFMAARFFTTSASDWRTSSGLTSMGASAFPLATLQAFFRLKMSCTAILMSRLAVVPRRWAMKWRL